MDGDGHLRRHVAAAPHQPVILTVEWNQPMSPSEVTGSHPKRSRWGWPSTRRPEVGADHRSTSRPPISQPSPAPPEQAVDMTTTAPPLCRSRRAVARCCAVGVTRRTRGPLYVCSSGRPPPSSLSASSSGRRPGSQVPPHRCTGRGDVLVGGKGTRSWTISSATIGPVRIHASCRPTGVRHAARRRGPLRVGGSRSRLLTGPGRVQGESDRRAGGSRDVLHYECPSQLD